MNRDKTFVMVPHRLTWDARWAAVYSDRETVGAWLQMLLTADACYPNPAPLPRLPEGVLDRIVAAGFIEVLPGDRYTWAGLGERRSAKSEQARSAAWARWGNAASNADGDAASNAEGTADRNAERNAESMPTQTQTQTRELPPNPLLPQGAAFVVEGAEGPLPTPTPPSHRPCSSRRDGTSPRARGRSPRQLRDGSPEIDRRALQSIGEALKSMGGPSKGAGGGAEHREGDTW